MGLISGDYCIWQNFPRNMSRLKKTGNFNASEIVAHKTFSTWQRS